MTIFDRANDLLKETTGNILGHLLVVIVVVGSPSIPSRTYLALIDNILKQFSASVFHDHDDIRWCGDDLVEFDDVGMSKELKILDFPLDAGRQFEGLFFEHSFEAGIRTG